MGLDLRTDCTFLGPAFPEPFVLFELETELSKLGLLPKTTGTEGHALRASWDAYRRKVRELAVRGGALRVRNHVVEPLVERFGYARLAPADEVETREGAERGGDLMVTVDGGAKLRIWCTDLDEDLAAPARRGAAWRYSHLRIAQRVLLASRERVGLLTNGTELHLLLCDPARPDSEIVIAIDPSWKVSREVPDSYRLVLALGSPAGVRTIPDLIDKARLQQARVTKELRRQARQAVERFVQEVLDHPENHAALGEHTDRARLARDLWREGLITVYRVLFVLKLESSDDPARAFSFASTSLWRSTFSPSVALAPHARAVLDADAETGHLLEEGLRALFRMFAEGLQCTELNVQPLGGALFGPEATPILSRLWWSERAVAHLLDRLLWTETKTGRQRVHYGPLDVEDLGRVYETLLELEPGITTEPMCRLRRQKLEVVVPLAQGRKYRAAPSEAAKDDTLTPEDDDVEEESQATGKKSRVEWIDEIHPGQFYLRVGLGRKATGSYYTPHSFVRFLVQETLGPQAADRSPHADPQPAEILKLKVLDPAMGSGHFLVEGCRFLGRALYEACRLCDERALTAERRAEVAKTADERRAALAEAAEYRQRLAALPDPDQEMVRYLPSRAPEGQESGFSQRKAEALCRRLVAVHCLYGVDKNPLAVELAKLALWIESHAEGLPLTFLDHRLVIGDSLTGPLFEHLLTYPGARASMDDLFTRGLRESFTEALGDALKHVHELEASTGVTLAEVESKRAAKARLDHALAPFRVVAAAWAGGVMLGPEACDDAGYARLVRSLGEERELPSTLGEHGRLRAMIARGLSIDEAPASTHDLVAVIASAGSVPALPYDLAFAEVFFPLGALANRRGFDAVFGNPPWETIRRWDDQFFAAFDFEALAGATKKEKKEVQERLLAEAVIRQAYEDYVASFQESDRIADRMFTVHKAKVAGQLAGRGTYDAFMLFAERGPQLLSSAGLVGWVLPSAFHANEGATGVRRLYQEQMALRCCYSFENRRKLFEIDSRFKFALVVASRNGPTREFPCAFYLHHDEWLFGDRGDRPPLRYTLDFVRRTGGEYLSLLELRTEMDLQVAETSFSNGVPFGAACERLGIRLGQELNMTYDAGRFTPTAEVLTGSEDPRTPDVALRLLQRGFVVLHEGKTFHQYDDRWDERPRYAVHLDQLRDRPDWLGGVPFYRLAFRDIASSTNERTAIFACLPPGCAFGNKAPSERRASARPTSSALLIEAIANSFCFDFLLRQRVQATINLFLLGATPVPEKSPLPPGTRGCLVHGALRLSCNHSGYAPLWREQMGEVWREPTPAVTWPVLAGDNTRWQVRSAIDAAVAAAYGLTRAQYKHVLSTFSHKSYQQAPALCLERFDELNETGLEAFTRKYDPYWDLPLNEHLPQPVVDVPLPADPARVREQGVLYGEGDTLGGAKRAAEEHAAYGPGEQEQVRARRRRGGRGRGGRG